MRIGCELRRYAKTDLRLDAAVSPRDHPPLVEGREESAKARSANVTVELVGHDGNAFASPGRVRQALREAGVPDEEIRDLIEEATEGDCDDLLQTVIRWVEAIG